MKNINTLLLYIFLILLLYCLMYTCLYNSKELIFDSDIDINNNNNENDKFENIDISYNEAQRYLTGLNNIKIGVNNSIVNNPYMENIKTEIYNLNNSINSQDDITLNNLSNVYMKNYLEYINKNNAIVYKEYEKLRNNYKK
jgi:hypothetical protein